MTTAVALAWNTISKRCSVSLSIASGRWAALDAGVDRPSRSRMPEIRDSRSPPRNAAISAINASRSASRRRACATRRTPGSVRRTPRVSRCSSGSPTIASSAEIRFATAGRLIPSCAAAAARLPSAAHVVSVSSSDSSGGRIGRVTARPYSGARPAGTPGSCDGKPIGIKRLRANCRCMGRNAAAAATPRVTSHLVPGGKLHVDVHQAPRADAARRRRRSRRRRRCVRILDRWRFGYRVRRGCGAHRPASPRTRPPR